MAIWSKSPVDLADRMMMKDGYRIFRRDWYPNEEPICICGTTVHSNTWLFLVRIKESEADDVESIKKNYAVGMNEQNLRITLPSTLKKYFPQLLIEYYEKNLVFVKNAKEEEVKVEDAARANLVDTIDTHDQVMEDGGPIYRDVLKDLPEQLATASVEEYLTGSDPPSKLLIGRKTSEELLKCHNSIQPLNSAANNEEKTEAKSYYPANGMDQFGLPAYYGETDYSDFCSSDSN